MNTDSVDAAAGALDAAAREVIERFAAEGLTLAVAESLTGGLVAAALTAVPGASAVFRGSVTAYATEVKASLLGVDAALLAVEGAVHGSVAEQMCRGVRRVLGADVGVATTGVAGPTEQDGKPVGLVYVGACFPDGTVRVTESRFRGDRAAVRYQAVAEALRLALSA